MTDELRDWIVDRLSVSEDRSIPCECARGGGLNNYLFGSVIRIGDPLAEVPCDEYRDFECNRSDCARMLSVTDWPTGGRNTRIVTCRVVDWKPQIEVDARDLDQYAFCERAFVEKLAEAANARGRIRECDGYWYCGNVVPPRNGKPRPFFVCMDPDRARLDEIDPDSRPVLLVVADKPPKVKIQSHHFASCVDLDMLGWKIEGSFFVDDCHPKGGSAAATKIGDMPISDFWAMQRTVSEGISREEREHIVAEIMKLRPRMQRPRRPVIRQEDVAEDFGVTRQTVNDWECAQTADGPENASNPYHYYRALRTNPDLRGAYEMLAAAAKAYNRVKEEFRAKGKRLRVAFEPFNEVWLRHNDAKTRHLE